MNAGKRLLVRAYCLATAAVSFPGHASGQQVATPVFSPGEGVYRSAQTVSISDTTPKSHIFYTVDGSTPTSSSTRYTRPITVSSSATVKAVAEAGGVPRSAVAIAKYHIVPKAAKPVIFPPGGDYDTPQTVSISDATSDATIYYTLDGSQPSTASAVYSGSLTVSATTVLTAAAIAPGYTVTTQARSTSSPRGRRRRRPSHQQPVFTIRPRRSRSAPQGQSSSTRPMARHRPGPRPGTRAQLP
jgi:hypothetical protein